MLVLSKSLEQNLCVCMQHTYNFFKGFHTIEQFSKCGLSDRYNIFNVLTSKSEEDRMTNPNTLRDLEM